MRKTFIYSPLLLPLLALSLGSCSSDDDGLATGQSGGAVTMTATLGTDMVNGDGAATRGTIEATWEGTEKLAVSMSSTDPTEFCTPRCYTVNTGGKLTHTGNTEANAADTEPLKWPGSATAVTFHGWHTAVGHGYRTEVNGQDFTMPTDQNTPTKIQAADFLYAPDVEVTDQFSAINLVCWHQFSLVDIYIGSSEASFKENATGITMLSTDWVGTARYTEPTGEGVLYGAWSSFTGENTDNLSSAITPLQLTDVDLPRHLHLRAIVMPQATSGKQLVSLTFDGKVYTYTLPNPHLAWMPGMRYTYRLWLGDDLFNVTDVPWEEDTNGLFRVEVEPWDRISDRNIILNANPWMSTGVNTVTTDPDKWQEIFDDYILSDPNKWQEQPEGPIKTEVELWEKWGYNEVLTTVALWVKAAVDNPLAVDPIAWMPDGDASAGEVGLPDAIWAIIKNWQRETENGTLGVLFFDNDHQKDQDGFIGGKPNNNSGTSSVEVTAVYGNGNNNPPTGYILTITYPDGRVEIRTVSGSQIDVQTQQQQQQGSN